MARCRPPRSPVSGSRRSGRAGCARSGPWSRSWPTVRSSSSCPTPGPRGWCGRSCVEPATWSCSSPRRRAKRSPPRSRQALLETAPGHPEIGRLTAPNPGPMTLAGTNTYLYGADPCTVIDPGPDDDDHLDAVRAEAEARGGIGLVLLTHSHGDHAAGANRLGTEAVLPAGGEVHGGLRAVATPGHAADHVCFLTDDGVCFSGD